jgi:hypothetical protein
MAVVLGDAGGGDQSEMVKAGVGAQEGKPARKVGRRYADRGWRSWCWLWNGPTTTKKKVAIHRKLVVFMEADE